MKLIKFKNGTYGVRVGNWYKGYRFLGLKNGTLYPEHYILDYCQGTEQEAREAMVKFNVKDYEIVKG